MGATRGRHRNLRLGLPRFQRADRPARLPGPDQFHHEFRVVPVNERDPLPVVATALHGRVQLPKGHAPPRLRVAQGLVTPPLGNDGPPAFV